MKHSFLKLAALAALSLGLLTSAKAVSLSVDWTGNTGVAGDFVGTIDPGSPASLADEVGYVNNLLGLGANATSTIASHGYATSDYDFNGSVSAANALDYPDNPPSSIPAGYEYVLGKFGNVSYVWYLGGEAFDIPSTLGRAAGLSHWVAFNPTKVPDGGMTAVLLGLGLVAVSFLARRRTA